MATVGQLVRNRWTVLIACIWIECCAGASYSFSIYSQTIKNNFGYTQQQLDLISVFKDIGEVIGVISGLIYDKFSPWVVLLVGALQNFMGYAIIWLYVTERLPTPAVWKMCVFICIAINGQTYYNTASIVTCVNNFPGNRGIIVGLMKGCLGLSSAILSRIWHVMSPVQRSDGSSFLLVAAFIPSTVAVLLMPVVRKYEERSDREKNSTGLNLFFTSGPIVLLALFLMGSAFWTERGNLQTNRVECIIALLILFSPLWVVWKTGQGRRNIFTDTITDHLISEEEAPDRHHCKEEHKNDCNDNLILYKNRSLWGILSSLDFFLMLTTTGIALGSGLAAVNNLSQVATSLDYKEEEVSVFVTLISIWQFLGRFGGGAFSDYLVSKFGIGRPLLIAFSGSILLCGYILIASSLPGTLYLGSIVVGLSLGANWSLLPTTTSELFGLSHFGTLYNVVQTGIPVVSYILSVWVAGYLYDLEAQKQGMIGGICKGSQCFNLAFIIMAGVCMVGVFASLILSIRSRSFYQKLNTNIVPEEITVKSELDSVVF
eukprot:Gb_19351 [translate_table: standard]